MKKANQLVVIFSVFTIGIFGSCHKTENVAEGNDKIKEPPSKSAAVCYENNGRPNNMLTYKEIVGMLTQYDKTRSKVLREVTPGGVEDTRINTYSIKELRDYLAYIEDLCKEKEIELTGINIISSAYPDDYPKKGYANKQTLIYMPVTRINGENATFDPLQSKKGKPVTFKELLAEYDYDWKYDAKEVDVKKEQKAGVFSFDLESDKESSGSNRGQVTPPPYYN